jgi:GTP cyclohydrolase II
MFAYVDPHVKERLARDGKLITIGEYGRRCSPDDPDHAPFISIVGPVPLPLPLGGGEKIFRWYAWVRHTELERIEDVVLEVRRNGPSQLFHLLSNHMAVNSVLLYGEFETAARPLVRVHSNCLTGDVFGSMRCDCGPQLEATLRRIVAAGTGALIYMAGHEGRGIGLWAKAITYLLQDAGEDTYQANESLGLPADSRDFSDAGRILRFFRGDDVAIRLLGNNPLKREGLEALGIEVVEQQPLVVGVNEYNTRYLTSKREHGHRIPGDALR